MSMTRNRLFYVGFFVAVICLSWSYIPVSAPVPDYESLVYHHAVDTETDDLRMYYRDAAGNQYNSFSALKSSLEQGGFTLDFAMNGGMYMEDRQPLGLYIEGGVQLRPLNRRSNAHGNFYLAPNGVFCLDTAGAATVSKTSDFVNSKGISYATQSGPMLLIDGLVHSGLTEGSVNLNIRNGVGVLPDGQVLFAMSKAPINFYDFAMFFKEQGCENALYLDGFVSRTYLPTQDLQDLEGTFGVIIAQRH
jgi:uncharacterized protein YigE (DUF2233 family)